MKKLYFLCLLLNSTTVFSQVGIGTTNPEASLHVAGQQSTVRIDALNVVNSPENDGLRLAPSYVQKNGELSLSSGSDFSTIFIVDASYAFNDKVVAVNDYSLATITHIYSYQITIPSESFVEVKYSLSFDVFADYDLGSETGARIFDGQARQIKTYFAIDGGAEMYGLISQNYYNISSGGGSGTFYNNGFSYLSLPPGTYTIDFFADIAGHDENTTAVVFGGDESLLRIRFY